MKVSVIGHILALDLKEHEVTSEHVTNMVAWREMCTRFDKNQIINKVAQRELEKEKDHWRKVLLRIILIVKFLAKHNLAFRGIIASCIKITMEISWAWLK
jgi:hypothetical protein